MITSKGEPGKLILISSDQLYNILDSTIDAVFYEPQPWLAMDEAYFKISKMNKDAFRRSFMEYQTILFLVTKESFTELKAFLPNMSPEEINKLFDDKNVNPIIVNNRYATPQKIYYLFANDIESMGKKLVKNREFLLTTIYNNEVRDFSARLFPNHSDTSNSKFKQIKSELGTGVAVSDNFELLKKSGRFFWFGERYSNEQTGIFCYRVPYVDTSQFNDNYLFSFRDSMMKAQVPGPREGTYMTTSASDIYPRFSEYQTINGLYAKKLRGWWTVQGEFMGGPYVLYAVLSKDNKYIFFYEGFIYAPNKSKSKNLRTLEAIGYTIQ
ncbi:MAG: DUF4837 family protein [Bacteroidetes bacterium]|nr:DUF4837 family protein [Bacteroidota bacterium]